MNEEENKKKEVYTIRKKEKGGRTGVYFLCMFITHLLLFFLLSTSEGHVLKSYLRATVLVQSCSGELQSFTLADKWVGMDEKYTGVFLCRLGNT